MKANAFAALIVMCVQAANAAPAMPAKSDLDDYSLEELLDLRASILEAKQNLTYYIEESDDDGDSNGDDNAEENSAGNEDDDD